jgi:GDP-4-dehydro-6-deoxy-D-mannose reductase
VKNLLLVGGNGFAGTHLRNALETSFAVASTGRDVDVRDFNQLHAFVSRVQPDLVVHLAAVTTLGESFMKPRDTYDINFLGTLNVLMALRESNFSGRMLFVSSSEVYGLIAESEMPVKEARLPKPMSPYAVSKIAAEALCHQWSQTDKLDIVIARPFNHIGPGQSERFAISDFGKQIAAIKLGLVAPVMHVGDIDTTRDFTDVRDIVVAYHLMLQHGGNGETYNVCSGKERTVRSLIERMCQLAGVAVELRTDPARSRPSQQRRVKGCNQKLFDATGWMPMHTMDQSLTDIVDYWVKQFNA